MLAIAALRHASGRLKAGMIKKIEIRRLPRLEFELDDSLKKQASLDAAMLAASQSRGEIPASDPAPEEHNQD
jgi:ribosome-binding factor A